MNSKTFWDNDFILETAKQRKRIELLSQEKKAKNNSFFAKVKKLFLKIF